MSAFEHIPLGRPIPNRPHAVSCSLPTMAAVCGYEEKDPAVLGKMQSGYPRFVVHPFARALAERLAAERGLTGKRLWLTSSARMADALLKHLAAAGMGATRVGWNGAGGLDIHGVEHIDTPELYARAKLYLQTIGGFLSSRQAEDALVRLGARPAADAEESFRGDAAAEVRHALLPALAGAAAGDLFLANNGMNAVYAAFRAVADLQAARGRTHWVQLGWSYLDTIGILKKFTSKPDDYLYVREVVDPAPLERLFAEGGSQIAGVVAEVPINPLIQTPDLERVAALCRRHGARLLVDPSVGSIFSVDVFRFADALVSSLTKYTSSDGDVIAGLAAVNPSGPDAGELRSRIASALEPVYPRDLSRMAAQIGRTEAVLAQIEASTPKVAAFLEKHPKVKEVFWSLHPASRVRYLKIARRPSAVGGMISFSVKGPLASFYDRLRLPKGPSFGMSTTLICPFMYLAHYDLVSTPAGRAELAAEGIDPELLRLCVGVEPAEEIIAALAEALS